MQVTQIHLKVESKPVAYPSTLTIAKLFLLHEKCNTTNISIRAAIIHVGIYIIIFKITVVFLIINSIYFVAVDEYDLLTAVKIPFEDYKTQYVEDGSDGFPALGFRPGSNVKTPCRVILPEKLTAEFSVLIRAKPRSSKGGYVFAVVNAYETVVQFGVKFSRVSSSTMGISFIYTEPSQLQTQAVANFTVGRFVNSWLRMSLKVTRERVTLFINCVEEESVEMKKLLSPLEFESSSTLYIAQAGPIIREDFEVSVFPILRWKIGSFAKS